MEAPEVVLADLRDASVLALGERLLGLYVHGSLVAGDFAPERSDLDVLAVLDADPVLGELTGLHAGLDRRHPQWAGRLEVEYVSLDAVHGTGRDHVMARTSPGEPLHLLPVTTHRVVTWAMVHDYGRALSGPPTSSLLAAVDPERVRAALRDHVRDWPQWVLRMTAPGGQAYAVLTLCRALQHLGYGRQLSKRQAADACLAVRPEWAELIVWARDWWYDGGRADDPGHFDDVRRFVNEISATVG